jgi:predicted SAM-dependent methyltransferase
VNYDNSPSVRLLIGWGKNGQIRYANALNIPHQENSVEVIYSSHMLEHLDRYQASKFLAEVRRVLRPGGILRLALPDIRKKVDGYLASGDADAFMEQMLVCVPISRLKMALVGPRHHLWMYDAKSLAKLLEQHGFTGIQEMKPGETCIPNPANLNLREREGESLYIEARAPF